MAERKLVNMALESSIVWLEVESGGVDFRATVNGHLCFLRMNDFPDEPLYTLSIENESVDLDQPPAGWIIPTLPPGLQ